MCPHLIHRLSDLLLSEVSYLGYLRLPSVVSENDLFLRLLDFKNLQLTGLPLKYGNTNFCEKFHTFSLCEHTVGKMKVSLPKADS